MVISISIDSQTSPSDFVRLRAIVDILSQPERDQNDEHEDTQQLGTDPLRDLLFELLGLSSGELLLHAAEHFAANESFDMHELSHRSGVSVETLLSKNRTLSHSCVTRQTTKAAFMHELNGNPRRFQIPSNVHSMIQEYIEAEEARDQNEETSD